MENAQEDLFHVLVLAHRDNRLRLCANRSNVNEERDDMTAVTLTRRLLQTICSASQNVKAKTTYHTGIIRIL